MPQSCFGIFATNAPDAPHLTPNSCFVAFRSVWVHWGPFRNCMKLGAKWPKLVPLMRKFVPRSRVKFLASSTPDPTHRTLNSCFCPVHNVRVHLELFCYNSKLSAKWAELVQLMQKFVPRSPVGIFRKNAPNPPHWTLNSCFGTFHSV